MNLKNLNDQTLIDKTQSLVREERELLTNILYHFREIERRRLYCDFKFGSLHKMLVEHFGYSDDEAYRRTAAMRLLTELPEVEEKVNSGQLSLSHLSLAKSFFRQEQKATAKPLTNAAKLEFIQKICEQPLREAQRIAIAESSAPEQLRSDRISPVSETKVEMRFIADRKLENKIHRLKGMLAHKNPNMNLGELIEQLCDIALERLTKQSQPSANSSDNGLVDKFATPRKPRVKVNLAELRRQIWRRDRYKCCNCDSTFALEIDHLHPKAKGGLDMKHNLRLLCRKCNQRAAIRHFGMNKMDAYLK